MKEDYEREMDQLFGHIDHTSVTELRRRYGGTVRGPSRNSIGVGYLTLDGNGFEASIPIALREEGGWTEITEDFLE